MKLPRLGTGFVFLVLSVMAASAAEPVAVKREATFSGTYVRGHKGMQMPKQTKSVPPKYPVEFRDARIAGTAVVEFIINAEGRPEEIQYSSASDAAFGEAACAAVKKWRYEPAVEGGKPVRIRTRQRIDFNAH